MLVERVLKVIRFCASAHSSLARVYCRCIAWVPTQDMRGDIAHHRVQVEEELPRQITEASV